MFLWSSGARMKKIVEDCPQCGKETTHRRKRKSFKLKKRGETYATINLQLKCMVCNYIHGSKVKQVGKKKQHIKA